VLLVAALPVTALVGWLIDDAARTPRRSRSQRRKRS
jgi:hypothetical protein